MLCAVKSLGGESARRAEAWGDGSSGRGRGEKTTPHRHRLWSLARLPAAPRHATTLTYKFRRIWGCQLSNRNKTARSKRNKECPAKLEIKIKLVTKDTKKKDEFLGKNDPPLPAVVVLTFDHNHTLDRADNLRFLRGDENLRATFCTYFDDGLSPVVARSLHYDKIRRMKDGIKMLANGHFYPTKNTVYWWYAEWTKQHFGTTVDPLDKLEEKIENYEQAGCQIAIKKASPWAVLVATPIMQRAQALESSSEIVFVDTTSTCDATHSNVTILLTATKAGAIPLAILIHESQTSESYKDAFTLLQAKFPWCFAGKMGPAVFMTDNSTAEKDALKQIWEGSTQLLCHFHVAQQEWRWLLDSTHGVEASDRKDLMKKFQKLMYSRTAVELEENLENFMAINHDGYRNRIEDFLQRKEEWVALYRDFLIIRGHNTNNYAEATVRILKDVILQRVKAYNVVALVDYIANVWDKYVESRLQNISDNRDSKPARLYETLLHRMKPELADKIIQYDEDMFVVPSSVNEEATYEVNMTVGTCLCKSGSNGAFCKHQALVLWKFGGALPNAPVLTARDRYNLAKLAYGNECPEPAFYLGMLENESETSTWNLEQSSCGETFIPEPSGTPTGSENRPRELSAPEKNVILEEFIDEVRRLHEVSGNEENYFQYLKTSTKALKRLKTGTGAMLRVSQALRQRASKRGKIHCQPTSVSRRSKGSSRGSARLPAGRRPNCNTKGRSATRGRPNKGHVAPNKPKRRRVLGDSIENNVAHVKKH